MSDWRLPWEGGCMCGEIRFPVRARPLLTMACHCTGCQKLSASAYSLTIAVPSEGFAITRGEPVVGGMHGPHRQLFCSRCKNWMFTHPQGMDFFVNVRATMLDDHSWYAPFIEVTARTASAVCSSIPQNGVCCQRPVSRPSRGGKFNTAETTICVSSSGLSFEILVPR